MFKQETENILKTLLTVGFGNLILFWLKQCNHWMFAKQPEHWLNAIFTINIAINLEKLLGE